MENPKSLLTPHQLEVYEECLLKGSGGLSLVMGYGKTLISIVLSLKQKKRAGSTEPILVVCSKTLIESWIHEIKKFFGSELKYEVLHKNYIKDIDNYHVGEGVMLVLTTPEVLTKSYKKYKIEEKFITHQIQNEGRFNQHYIKCYETKKVNVPFLRKRTGIANIFSTKWSSLVVDEVQKYTNISNIRCQAMGAICSHHRWVLSGTMFSEPIIERILGYYVIIQDLSFPNNIPAAKKFVESRLFNGFDSTIVKRKKNPSFIKPIINQQIISHDLTKEEEIVYKSMKAVFNMIEQKKQTSKAIKNNKETSHLRGILLALIGYLRQSLVCPVLPLMNKDSEISKKLVHEVEKNGLGDWMNDESSVKSSRFIEALKVIDKHPTENIVVFSCFRKCLDIFEGFLPSDRRIFTLTSDMSSDERFKILEEFGLGRGNILLLTYDIGAEGLNLQASNTVVLLDFFWNDGKTQQAIARVLRYGQVAPVVNIYMFTGNTAIEKAMFEKHDSKLTVIDELSKGSASTKISRVKIEDILKIINKEDNLYAIKKIHKETRATTPFDKLISLKKQVIEEIDKETLNILKIKEYFKEMINLDVTIDILKRSDIMPLLRYLRDVFSDEKVNEYSRKLMGYWKRQFSE
jgi:SNF2 family DNA or RNA helicase